MSALTAATEAAVAAVTSGSVTPAPGAPTTPTPTAPQAAPAAPSPLAAPPVSPVSATPTDTPSAPAAGPASVALDDQTIYMVDGVPKTGKELKGEQMMRADYTRKTQELATQRKQFEAMQPEIRRALEERQQMAAILNDQRVNQFVRQLRQAQQPQPPQPPPAQAPSFDPNEIATVGQAQQVAQQQVAALQQQIAYAQQQFDAKLAAMENTVITRAQNNYELSQYKQSIDPLVQRLVRQDHPILAAIPEVESLLRYQVLQRIDPNERDVNVAVRAFQEEAQTMANKLQAHWTAQQQHQQQASAQLASQGIEPPGGAPPALSTQPRTFQKPDGTVDWNGMFEQATAYVASRR